MSTPDEHLHVRVSTTSVLAGTQHVVLVAALVRRCTVKELSTPHSTASSQAHSLKNAPVHSTIEQAQ